MAPRGPGTSYPAVARTTVGTSHFRGYRVRSMPLSVVMALEYGKGEKPNLWRKSALRATESALYLVVYTLLGGLVFSSQEGWT